jgi:antitoxin component of RelBE/YafQ-DinJ toxin-antitoxin module
MNLKNRAYQLKKEKNIETSEAYRIYLFLTISSQYI